MKLELKHLAPYLPYKIQVALLEHPLGITSRVFELDCGHDFHFYLENEFVKPLLKRITDLSEEDLAQMFLLEFGLNHVKPEYKDWYIERVPAWISITHSSTAAVSKWFINQPLHNEYWKLDFLASKGYDVFNLIEQDLAFDVKIGCC